MTRPVVLATLAVLVAVSATALFLASPRARRPAAWSTAARVAPTNPIADCVRPHLDHRAFYRAPLATGPAVTRTCLGCHPDAAAQVKRTAHFTWLSGDVERGGERLRIGKRNLMNNFCISVVGNWASCTKCHAGYGWTDDCYDFSVDENVDCLVCHDGSGSYVKDKGGLPGPKVNLAAVAGSVRVPYRENCGYCHFNGGGGMGVKHGDLDDSLLNASADTDVHMGRLGFQCIDCHETRGHLVPGKVNATYSEATHAARFDCTTCHAAPQHADAMLNKHVARVACQTCHIPAFARKYPTKMDWDWSKAGDATRADEPHAYLKIKGEFVYEDNVRPTYAWWNGRMDRYVVGDKLTSDDQAINQPRGDRGDPDARIWPFKVHQARQIFDPVNRVLIPPVTSGTDGYWSRFDWSLAATNGMKLAGLPYSGQYDFTRTHMYWPINHMVAPASAALTCTACHGADGRLDWRALGYDRDPAGGIRHED